MSNRLDADFDQSHQRLQLVDELNAGFRLALSQFVHQPHEFQLQAGQNLTQLIVQLACDARPLILARIFQAQGQRVQAVLF